MTITVFTLEHYESLLALWQRTPGLCLREADTKPAIERYLARNPGLSFVAIANGQVIGSALCGHDGRRAYLQHVVVDAAYRGRGVGQRLVASCLEAIRPLGIDKVHLDVLATNTSAQAYWAKRGWQRRDDIVRYSLSRDATSCAAAPVI